MIEKQSCGEFSGDGEGAKGSDELNLEIGECQALATGGGSFPKDF
jgi:hypothetical protein